MDIEHYHPEQTCSESGRTGDGLLTLRMTEGHVSVGVVPLLERYQERLQADTSAPQFRQTLGGATPTFLTRRTAE